MATESVRAHRGAGVLASDPARFCRAEPAGDGAGQQILAASAVEPSEQDLCPRRGRDRCLNPGGSGRRLRGGARPDCSGNPDPCHERGTHPRRRHNGARAGETEDVTGRIWTYVRDDRPFGSTDPPAALFYYSRNGAGEHPQSHLAGYVGLMQADAFDGYNQLYKAQRKPAPILEAACWSHGRRKFFDLAKSGEAPIASEAVRRIDVLFEIERTINSKTPEQRLAVRREKSRPLVADLEIWMRQQRALLSSNNDTAKAINYLLNRWAAFTRFLDDGRVCLSNNAAERALRGVAIGRMNWTFAGSDGGHRAAAVYTLIETCKMNDVDPQAWLVLARLPDHPANKVADLLPWNWKASQQQTSAAA
jgi:transposase